ncbi:MAG: hypothetical protein IKI75_04000 [Lachnospiraceae bacterium]|nr:hypothetical protein [Lachnospiraceae bacterium]
MGALRSFFKNDKGMGTVEIILIIVVLVGLVLIFKNQIISIINDMFASITDKSNTIAH